MSFTNPTRAAWQPGHIPQLKYRTPVPSEDRIDDAPPGRTPLRDFTNVDDEIRPVLRSEDSAKSAGPTIRQIRQSMQQTVPPALSALPMAASRAVPPPKKKSMFGSLFTVKEPTQMALSQVQAQMIAQHGSTSATRVPNVPMGRMPEHVPKVNTKWDGIPDQVKIRDKQSKERQRELKRQSLGGSKRSQSVDSEERKSRSRISCATSSNGSRPESVGTNRSNHKKPNPHRFYAASCNSSGDLAAQQREQDTGDHRDHRPKSSTSQSFRSPSGTSLPDMTAFSLDVIPANPPLPEKYRAVTTPKPGASLASDRLLIQTSSYPTASLPSIEAIPDHTSSPVATPRDGSPVTPLTQQASGVSINEMTITTAFKPENISISKPSPNTLPPPATKIWKLGRRSPVAFLAGEAKELQLPEDDEGPSADLPFRSWGRKSNMQKPSDRPVADVEKRPDSSRARLGFRASMLVRTDTAPWEGHDDLNTPPLSPASATTRTSYAPSTPRTFLSKSYIGSLRSTRS